MLKTQKRFLTVGMAVLVLISALIFVMPAVKVSAAGLWTSHAADGFAGGDGSSGSPYKISSAAELARMAENINRNIDGGAFLNKYYELTADIDLSGYEWEPMGTSSYKFKGSFDGNEYKIKNLNISSGTYVGLFGYIGQGGSVENVVVESGSITGTNYVGGVCGYNNGGTISNCSNSAEVSGFSYVGGICGRNVGTVTGCKNLEDAKVNGTSSSAANLSSYIGGVCGYNEDYSPEKNLSIVSSCYNYAEIGSNIYNSDIGGICGFNSGTIQNCHNLYKVCGDSKVGGVCGENQAYIKKSSNKGEVNGETTCVGGICGYSVQSTNLPDFVIENCTNEGSVICNNDDGAETSVGGVCGSSQIKISNCTNSGEVYCPSSAVGGICGTLYESTIIDCSNSGDITNDWDFVGGVCGISYSGTIENSYNTGNIITEYAYYVGGVCGEISGDFADDNELIVSKVKDCYNTGKVVSQCDLIGGVCGHAWIGVIENCYNANEVSGSWAVSGVCGSSEFSTIKNCYNIGSVTGDGRNIGGVCGYDWFSFIEKCYSIGVVTGEEEYADYVGSVCGFIDTEDYGNDYVHDYESSIKNCYYNKDIIKIGGISGSDTDSVKGLTTIEMTCGDALTKMGFDTTVWEKKPNDKTSENKQAYYPNLKAFTYVPSVGFETELKIVRSDTDSAYSYGDTIDFDISALVKFEGMESFTADTNEPPLASGKGSLKVMLGDDTVVDATDIYDNTIIKNVTSSEINTSEEAVTFTLYYDGTDSDYFPDGNDTCDVNISKLELDADDFIFTAPEDSIYNGNDKEATVEAKPEVKEDISKITVKYYLVNDDGSLTELVGGAKPVNVGTYKVKIDVDVEDGSKYIAATDLTADDWTFTIDQSTRGDTNNATNPDNNALHADLELTDEDIISKIPLTPEELEAIENGADLEVYMVVIDYSGNVPANDKALAEAALTGNMQIGMYIDVSLFVKVGDNEPRAVTKTNGNLKITFEMPEKLINTDKNVTREYYIIRVHEGKASVLGCEYDASTGKGSFSTDQFSTYAIAYRDTSAVVKYPVDMGSSGLIKADKTSAEAGEKVTITVTAGYIAHVYDSTGNEIATISGTGSFIMPAGGVKITAEYPISLALTWQNSYIYSYDSGMNYITVNKTRKQGTITVNLGKEYAGKSFVIYEGKKSTKVIFTDGTLDKNGKFTLEVEDGKNYTLVVED